MIKMARAVIWGTVSTWSLMHVGHATTGLALTLSNGPYL